MDSTLGVLVENCLVDQPSVEDIDTLREVISSRFGVKIHPTAVPREAALAACLCVATRSYNGNYFDHLDSVSDIDGDETGSNVRDQERVQLSSDSIDVEPFNLHVATEKLSELFARLEAALVTIGSETPRYLKLAAKLGTLENKVVPLDIYQHLFRCTEASDDNIVTGLKKKIQCVREENAFWTEMTALVNNLDKETRTSDQNMMDKSTLTKNKIEPIEVLDNQMELFRDAINDSISEWTAAKDQLNQKKSASFIQSLKTRAKKIIEEYEKEWKKAGNEAILQCERIRMIDDAIAPFLLAHPTIRKHHYAEKHKQNIGSYLPGNDPDIKKRE